MQTVENLFSITAMKQEADSSNPLKTVFVHRGSIRRGKHFRRFTDGSVVTNVSPSLLDAAMKSRRKSTNSESLAKEKDAIVIYADSQSKLSEKFYQHNIDRSDSEFSDTESAHQNKETDEFHQKTMSNRKTSILPALTQLKQLKNLDTLKAPPTVSGTKMRSLREMLTDISTRAKANIEPPSYVVKLEELSPEMLTWRKKPNNGSLSKTILKNNPSASTSQNNIDYIEIDNGNESDGTLNTGTPKNSAQNSMQNSRKDRTQTALRSSSLDIQVNIPSPKSASQSNIQFENSSIYTHKNPADLGPVIRNGGSLKIPMGTSEIKSEISRSEISRSTSGSTRTFASTNSSINSINVSNSDSFRGSFRAKRISVDIIGCQHSVGLILARANATSRRHSLVAATRNQNMVDEQSNILQKRELRLNWCERKDALIKLNNRRNFWLKMIILANFNSKIIENHPNNMIEYLKSVVLTDAANIIRIWYLKMKAKIHIKMDKQLSVQIKNAKTVIGRCVSAVINFDFFGIFLLCNVIHFFPLISLEFRLNNK